MTSYHCDECRELGEFFGFDQEQADRTGQWHEDHPGWHVSREEEEAMARYVGEA